MKKILALIVLLNATFALYAQSTNSSVELLRKGTSARKAKKEAQSKLDKELYWLGKVPVKEGLVVFEKKYDGLKLTKSQIFDAMANFAQQLIDDSKHPEVSQIASQDADDGKIICILGETMYFKRAKWETDYANFYYQLLIDCKDGSCNLKIKNLQYRYEEEHEVKGEYIKAEEWITDEAAFNKSKTAFLKETGKFRRATINRFNEIISKADNCLK